MRIKVGKNISNIPTITPEIEAEAVRNPGGWVYKVDWDYAPDQYTPPESVVGAFEVDENGKLTGKFEENPNYRPVKMAARPARDYMNRVRPPHQSNQWVTEIDPAYDEQFPAVPPEGQTGSWYVGEDGRLTGQFRPNPFYTGDIKT